MSPDSKSSSRDELSTRRRPDRSDFLLDDSVIFLNHGSFGACPRVVFEKYQALQRQLESEPVRFIQQELPNLVDHVRQVLCQYVNAEPGDLVMVPNPTFAVNTVARSLDLQPGDEILTTDHEYGACIHAWEFVCQKTGARLVKHPVPLPVESTEQVLESLSSAMTDRTKMLFISHITSATALTFPIAEICSNARARGILTMIDGAHAPGQIDVDLQQIPADFYTATCHKWMCAPKGSAFLFVRKERQSLIEPLVVGWGWGPDRTIHVGSDFLDAHEWLGTHDPSTYLAIPTAIDFQAAAGWTEIRDECHQLAIHCTRLHAEQSGMSPIHADRLFQQMALLPVPLNGDRAELQRALLERHRIQVPVIDWNNHRFVRVSVQAYNTADELDALMVAMREVFFLPSDSKNIV